MSTAFRFTKKQIRKHILIWITIIMYLNFDEPVPGPWAAQLLGGVLLYSNYAFVFYSIDLFIFPKFWNKGVFNLFLFLLITLIIYWSISYAITFKIIPYLGGSSFYQKYSIFFFLGKKCFYFFIISLAGTASFFYRYSSYKLKLQVEKEKSLLVKELNFLKNQFNSHITFNFLNYCYSRVHKYSDAAADSIELFSEMLRYTLKTRPGEKVPLNDEFIYLQSFIKLQKHLFPQTQLYLNYTGDFQNRFVPPTVLTSILEKAIESKELDKNRCKILINLDVVGNKLLFSVKKQIEYKGKHLSIDFKEVRQVLDLYSYKYELLNNITEKLLCINLIIEGLDNEKNDDA